MAGKAAGQTSVTCIRHEEIIKHFIFIGGTDQLAYRHSHIFRIESRQNIAEIPCGNHHVDLFTILDLALM